MIYGIGTDIVKISRMEKMLQRHGRAIAERILAPEELQRFDETAQAAPWLAKRFAAKEATAKALGSGFRDGLSLRHIAVVNLPSGKPELVFYERGAEVVQALAVDRSHLSLADEEEYAIAYVILEQGEGGESVTLCKDDTQE
ncbi:MAG: holo-ACP synthase [Gammaproteobacteria bacterium]|nr:holo-ACP synthase [Gammaproteobacteria bacterium]